MTVPATGGRRPIGVPDISADYLRLVGDGDEEEAVAVVTGLLDAGVPPQRVMIDLIAATQRKVGELWAANEWTIAREHAATAISERALAALAARTVVAPTRGRIAIACVDGEWHALPVRILAETLRLHGWRVDFLGANVPGRHLVTHLHQTGPDAVALSCTLPTGLPRAHAAIVACRTAGVPVIAGGRGFGPDGRYARRLGADAWAAGAEDAADRLESDWPPPMSDPADGAFLGDDEYTYVMRHRVTLIETALARLHTEFPGAGEYDQRRRDATAEDLGHIVDFLAAALYVGDQRVFTDFVEWTAGVLSARTVPAEALAAGLRLCRDQLRDYPVASGLLEAGLTRLAQPSVA